VPVSLLVTCPHRENSKNSANLCLKTGKTKKNKNNIPHRQVQNPIKKSVETKAILPNTHIHDC
jgi:hypothetical protein